MKRDLCLSITSLTAILLMSVHLAEDVVRGFEPGGFKNLISVLTLVLWLYGVLVLAGRPSGYLLLLLGSLLASMVPIAHMMGKGLVGGRIANSSGILFWVWTLIALAISANLSVVLALRALWSRAWRQPE